MPVVKLDTTTPPETKTEAAKSEPHHSAKHHAKPLVPQDTPQETPKTTAQNGTTTQVPSAQPTEMSPIGQLSTANDNANTADRRNLSDQIDATENGLNAIKRSFTPDEQKTVALIRTYITRARDALKADDLDGSRTLSTKARQLLEELTKPERNCWHPRRHSRESHSRVR
jgi:hypothetical protein